MPLDCAVISGGPAHDTVHKQSIFPRLKMSPQGRMDRERCHAYVAHDGFGGRGTGLTGCRSGKRWIAVKSAGRQNGQSKADRQCSHGVTERRNRGEDY